MNDILTVSSRPVKSLTAQVPPTPNSARALAAAGEWLRGHQRSVRAMQWGVVTIYAILLIVPVLVPLPDHTAHVWDNITLFARFVFWGIWWPGVLLSMLLFGRLWCGVFCPEGALSEMASRRGKGRAIPSWIRWPGWPFVAFVITTIYGQMISVYQYPAPALLILGGSTVAAILIGYLYGRNHRVWCRYLCPVNGVFGLLAKLAPMHYGVNRQQWERVLPTEGRTTDVTCAPLVPLKTMESTSPCHMCGRCAGFRDAIELRPRLPGAEVVEVSRRTATHWDSLLIIVGLMGVAVGAFHWSSSPWFVTAKQGLATWLVGQEIIWPLEQSLPWWILTNNPAGNDVLSVLDGTVLLTYIVATTLTMSLCIGLPLALSAQMLGTGWTGQRFHHLAHGLLPIAACGVILGLSAQTVSILRSDEFPLFWVDEVRCAMIALSGVWSLWLIWRISGQYSSDVARLAATVAGSAAVMAGIMPWILLFWVW